MKKVLKAMAISFSLIYLTGNAFAAPLIPNETNDGPDIYQAVNLLLVENYTGNGDSSLTVRQTNNDQLWSAIAGGGFWAVVGLSAGFTNTFGYYTDPGVGSIKTDIWTNTAYYSFTGDGSAANPFVGPGLSIAAQGVFGFFLNSDGQEYLYSESGLNSDGMDHMTTYSLPELAGGIIYTNPLLKGTAGFDPAATTSWTLGDSVYLVAWEDIVGGGDGDYDDMMFLVSKVQPVPEPATMLLFGAGLAGLAGFRRKNQMK